MKWVLRPGPALHWRQWDTQRVVFDPLSGDTHLLDEPWGEFLFRLDQPADADEVARWLATAGEGTDGAERREQAERFLTMLDKLALVQAVSP